MCGVSFILCGIFVIVNSYDLITSLAIMAYMLVKLVEGFADVLHGIAQKKWRLDIAGKSFVLRGVLLLASFLITMSITKNLSLAVFMMAVTTLLALLLYDFLSVKKIDSFKTVSSVSSAISLSKVCLPMIAYGACINAIIPLSKYVLEIYHGNEVLGYYASVATIAVLIQAFFSFVFTPLIGIFEDAYSKNDKKAILSLLLKLVVLLIGTTLIAFAAIAIAGEFAMTLVFGESIRDYVYLLYPTVIASTLTALVWLMGMLLVVMRDLKALLIGAFLGFVTGAVLAIVLIPDMVYTGTNIAIIAALSLIVFIYCIKFVGFFLGKQAQLSPFLIDSN
jgi:O-antigen/teichoic acid export membrane protein